MDGIAGRAVHHIPGRFLSLHRHLGERWLFILKHYQGRQRRDQVRIQLHIGVGDGVLLSPVLRQKFLLCLILSVDNVIYFLV